MYQKDYSFFQSTTLPLELPAEQLSREQEAARQRIQNEHQEKVTLFIRNIIVKKKKKKIIGLQDKYPLDNYYLTLALHIILTITPSLTLPLTLPGGGGGGVEGTHPTYW